VAQRFLDRLQRPAQSRRHRLCRLYAYSHTQLKPAIGVGQIVRRSLESVEPSLRAILGHSQSSPQSDASNRRPICRSRASSGFLSAWPQTCRRRPLRSAAGIDPHRSCRGRSCENRSATCFMQDAGIAVLLAAVQDTARLGTAHGECAPLLTLHGYTAGLLVADARRRSIVSVVSPTDPPQRPNCRWFCLLLQD
jgi:hypothetical protein